ncbi:hypothetical protein HPB48_018231 [Haemaphysalis longicornis]|uniref:Uncharacterized protein n=1 Tax=Haemaphysalis longicornis TaxID=44386 RepID=A0A9J6FDM7_HAELO|nr:hypothetical protein HPB48_018231 [Haemaphysalis longicornis]
MVSAFLLRLKKNDLNEPVCMQAEKFTSYWTDPKTPGLRLGICLVDQCNERDIQSLVRTSE